jgi:hypothetical protein
MPPEVVPDLLRTARATDRERGDVVIEQGLDGMGSDGRRPTESPPSRRSGGDLDDDSV